MSKYFVCVKVRSWIDDEYARKFYNNGEYYQLYDTYDEAWNEILTSFYDDSDTLVYKTDGTNFEKCPIP